MRNVKTYRFEKDILTYLSSNVMYGPLLSAHSGLRPKAASDWLTERWTGARPSDVSVWTEVGGI